ncbi:hypothetical protein [Halostella sp. PRR32]|uniref:DUF7311 family protein n=1 Tax=Halostella sp. PRR32 TaxID=3098147 RepID=UPI002B1E353E|nr:hypothetical protein [Halostella sp. PRR32]
MTVRVVIAAVLATALVAAALPAVDAGRERASDTHLRGEVDELERSAAALLEREETAWTESNAPQRTVTVRIPERGWWRAGVDFLAIRAPPDGSARGRVTYKVDGRRERVCTLDLAMRPRNGPIDIRRAGEHDLRLRLVRDDGNRTVVVDRPRV